MTTDQSDNRLLSAIDAYDRLMGEWANDPAAALCSMMDRPTEIERAIAAEAYVDRFGGDYVEALRHLCLDRAMAEGPSE